MSDSDYSALCKEFNISPERLATLKEVYGKRKVIPKEKWEKEIREMIKEDLDSILRAFGEIPEILSFENFVRLVHYDEENSTAEQIADIFFWFYDTDNSGFLELPELNNMFCNEEISKDVITHFDSNGDGKLSKEEFVDMLKIKKLSKNKENIHDVESVRLFFKIVDRDQNGYLDEGELDLFWKIFNLYEFVDEDVLTPKVIMALADTDKDGKLSFEEFMGFFAMESPKATPEVVAEIFMSLFDKNGDGFLDRSEIQPFVENRGIGCTVTEFLDNFDINGDGKVSKEELVEVFRKLEGTRELTKIAKLL